MCGGAGTGAGARPGVHTTGVRIRGGSTGPQPRPLPVVSPTCRPLRGDGFNQVRRTGGGGRGGPLSGPRKGQLCPALCPALGDTGDLGFAALAEHGDGCRCHPSARLSPSAASEPLCGGRRGPGRAGFADKASLLQRPHGGGPGDARALRMAGSQRPQEQRGSWPPPARCVVLRRPREPGGVHHRRAGAPGRGAQLLFVCVPAPPQCCHQRAQLSSGSRRPHPARPARPRHLWGWEAGPAVPLCSLAAGAGARAGAGAPAPCGPARWGPQGGRWVLCVPLVRGGLGLSL